jgi:hypothetical protein
MVYFVKGAANISIGNKEQAKKDFLKTIELDESFDDEVMALSKKYHLGLED